MRWRCPGCKDVTERDDGFRGIYCTHCGVWRKVVAEPRVVHRRRGVEKTLVFFEPVPIIIEEYPCSDHLFNPPGEGN